MDAGIVCLLLLLTIVIIVMAIIFTNESTTSLDTLTSQDIIILEPSSRIKMLAAPKKTPSILIDSQIPQRIYQTQQYSQVPVSMETIMQHNIALNPDFGYKYYDNFQVQNFIMKHMPPKVVRAYNLLIPGAYKADLFRYCLLYIKGGIYIDSSFRAETPLSVCLHSLDRFVSCVDSPYIDVNGNQVAVYNAFMASVPRHPILEAVIDLVVDRILNRDKGNSN